MGQIQILDKLSQKFKTTPSSEEDVVYALSKIRKVLEMDNYPEKYSILNFYCNLALHSKIGRYPKKVEDMLTRVRKGNDYSDSLVNFTDFHRQLNEFSEEHNLPKWSNKYKINQFNKFLNSIFSDTPITLKITEFEIKIDEKGIISILTL